MCGALRGVGRSFEGVMESDDISKISQNLGLYIIILCISDSNFVSIFTYSYYYMECLPQYYYVAKQQFCTKEIVLVVMSTFQYESL